MKSAIKSFIIVTASILICLGLAWIYLKSKASSQIPQKPVPTTFFDGLDTFFIAQDGTSTLPQQANIIWLDTQITKDKKIVILKDHEIANPNFDPASNNRSPEIRLKRLAIRYMNWTDVQKSVPYTKLLTEVFEYLPQQRWIINVVDYAPGADQVYSDTISKAGVSDRIIFHSEQDGPLTDLRKLQPMWLYGTSRAQIVQSLWLTTLGLEGLAPLKGDVLITSLHASQANKNALLINESLLNEAHRRSMKVLIGPATQDELDQIKSFKVDGAILKLD